MICFVSPKDTGILKSVGELCSGVCGCRILCLLESYGRYDNLVELWMQYNDAGEKTAVLLKYSGDMTVSVSDNADISELREFISAVGAVSVQSEIPLTKDFSEAVIMLLKSRRDFDIKIFAEQHPLPEAVYSLMKQCSGEGFSIPLYEDFLLDFSHRMRHGTALCRAVMHDKTAVSFAMTTALSESSAVIGSVCTLTEYRHSGIGTACVNSLIDGLGDRNVYVVRHPQKNEQFYRKMGFENHGTLYIKNRR